MIRTLFYDIEKKIEKNKDLTFWLGVVLLSETKNETNGKTYTVIDGQQRILTMFLIFKEFLENFKIEEMEDRNNSYGLYDHSEKGKQPITSKIIIEWLKGGVKKNKRLNNIAALIRKEGEAIIEKVKKNIFVDYLKERIKCTLLILPENNYEYFENINSKTVKLTLTEKCLSFLIDEGKRAEIFKKSRNVDLFKWLLKSKKPKSDDFFKYFSEIFGKSEESDPFWKFKDFFIEKRKENLGQFQIFLDFLEETKKLVENSDRSFEMLYLKEVCFQDYWIIYVKSKVEKNDEFINYFLKTIWKFDLIRHLNRVAKISIKELVIGFTQGKITKLNYEKILVKILKRKDWEGDDVVLSYDGRISEIGDLRIVNITTKRLKTFLFLLYSDEKDLKKYSDFVNSKNVSDEHFCSSKGKEVDKYSFSSSDLEQLANKHLLDKDKNLSLSNKPIEKKIELLTGMKKNEISFFELPKLENELISDFKSVANNEGKKLVTEFWKARNKSLDKRLDVIRDNSLTLKLKLSFSQEEERKKLRIFFLKCNNLIATKDNHIFETKDNHIFYLGFFDKQGKKTKRVKLQINSDHTELLQIKKNNEELSGIIGCNDKDWTFYTFDLKKFLKYKKNGTLSFQQTQKGWCKLKDCKVF